MSWMLRIGNDRLSQYWIVGGMCTEAASSQLVPYAVLCLLPILTVFCIIFLIRSYPNSCKASLFPLKI